MVLEKNTMAISIPFSAGVAMMAAMPSGIEMSFHAAALSQLAAVALLIALCFIRRSCNIIPLLFFLLGVSCYSCSTIFPPQENNPPPIVSHALGWLNDRIDAIGMKEVSSALTKALLTGSRQWLSAETTAAFRSSGASHILALSGLHMGMIYAVLRKTLAALGNSRPGHIIRSAIIMTACAFYTAMTGAGPSVTRAMIFIFINEVSEHTPGRQKRASNVLMTAMMIQLFFSPQEIKTLAFQLSYLAMAGIITVYPKMKGWIPEKWSSSYPGMLWGSLSMSISCQIFTAPLVWIHFGTFPVFFMLTNLIALPLAESFIILMLILILPLTPSWLAEMTKGLAETICQTLIFCLETISSLT